MNQTTHKMTDPIQIKHYKEDITSFNQLYKEFQRRFVRFANSYVRDLTTVEDITIEATMLSPREASESTVTRIADMPDDTARAPTAP